jgi:hypothetical protein
LQRRYFRNTSSTIISFRYYTSSSRCIGNDTLNGVAVTTTNTNVTPTTGPILVDADGNVTIAANTPTGPYTVTYTICESDTTTGVNVSPSNCTTATLTVNVVGKIIAGNDTLGTPLAPLASGTTPVAAGSVMETTP